MNHEPWMCRDERTPDEIRCDRLRNLRHEEASIQRRLETVQAEIRELDPVT